MVKIKIIKDGVKGADDGATVRPYAKGVVYDVSDALAEVFIEAKEGEEVAEAKPTATDRVKAKADKAAAEKEAAEKAAAEKEAAEKAAAEKAAPAGMPAMPDLKAAGK